MADGKFLPPGMKWSFGNILIVIPLLPLVPLVMTWFLPWETWIPKNFSKWFIGPYFLYAAVALWHFHFSRFIELAFLVFGVVSLALALEEKYNN